MPGSAWRWPRNAVRILTLALLLALGTFAPARASWTGYWTWSGTAWVWTWVWAAPTTGGSVSAVAARGLAADGECCGLTISGFGALALESVTFSGLLATDFAADIGARTLDLVLRQTSDTPIAPGAALGTITLFAPAIGPQADPPLLLGFDLRTRDASGVLYREIGAITSAPVPEPASALVFGTALCFAGLAYRFGRGRHLPPP